MHGNAHPRAFVTEGKYYITAFQTPPRFSSARHLLHRMREWQIYLDALNRKQSHISPQLYRCLFSVRKNSDINRVS